MKGLMFLGMLQGIMLTAGVLGLYYGWKLKGTMAASAIAVSVFGFGMFAFLQLAA